MGLNLDKLYQLRDEKEEVFKCLTMVKILARVKPQLVRAEMRSLLKAHALLSSPSLADLKNPFSGIFASILILALKDADPEEDFLTGESAQKI